jgi:hypothetical protein
MATTTKPFSQRIGYQRTCVVPATLLSDDMDEGDTASLRSEASRNGLCYLQVVQSFDDGTYLARVAATPDLVPTQGFTVVLSEDQLTSVIPWDCRTPERLRDLRSKWNKPQESAIDTVVAMPQQKGHRRMLVAMTRAS